MGNKLLLIGGGGHCRSVLDSVLSLGLYDEIGVVDSIKNLNLGIPVVGNDDDIPALVQAGWTDAFITVGSIGDTVTRRRLYELVKQNRLNIPTIIDPSAVVGKEVEFKEGVFVGKQAVVNIGSSVGVCVIINTGAIVEHDCIIGDFSHISSGSTLCGQARVGYDSHIGAGSVVRQSIKVGNRSLIGIGSVVVKDIPDNVKAYGNPCKVVE